MSVASVSSAGGAASGENVGGLSKACVLRRMGDEAHGESDISHISKVLKQSRDLVHARASSPK